MREKTKFMNNPFSQRISDVIQFSKEEANRLRNNYIGPEHLLLGLIREGEGKAVQILKDLYVDLEMVKKIVGKRFKIIGCKLLKIIQKILHSMRKHRKY